MNRRGQRRQRIRAQRMYRLLVRLYPAAHRQAFGQQMVQTFGDHYRDAVQCHGGSRLRFWFAVLADTATSVVTEHTAEVRARRRRAASTRPLRHDSVTGNGSRRRARRCSVRTMRDMAVEQRGGMRRRTRVRRRLRYRRSACRRARVLIRTRHHQLLYRGRLPALALTLVVFAAAGLAVGTATAHLRISALVTGLLLAVWLGYRLRLTRPVPAGPNGDGPTPPGGAGVREPRRPLPMSPAGAAARPMLDHEPPGQATAVI